MYIAQGNGVVPASALPVVGQVGTADGKAVHMPFASSDYVANGFRGPVVVNVTASGDTTLIAAPGVGFAIRVVMIYVSINNAALVKFKEGAAGNNGWVVDSTKVNIFDIAYELPWKIAANTALVVNASVNPAAWVTVQYYVSIA
jgi:hypothetical protein